MATIDKSDIYELYEDSVKEKHIWQEDYEEFERLANNDIIDDLDENLPEVNDGTLSASLYKLPKRLFSSKLKGRAKATNRDDGWLTELANIRWENNIIPNANMQAPFSRKWKDAIRKSAIYGSVPLITMFVEHGDTEGADFYVGQPQDWTLEAGKVSDYDCQVIFGDLFFTRTQLKDMIEEAKSDNTDKDAYKKWDVDQLQKIYDAKMTEDRDPRDVPVEKEGKAVTKGGYHFTVAYQRGVEAPFCIYHYSNKKTPVCEWSNPDPSGDLPVHYLYCYQDFINPYGTGIVKLAGGTQNVLDYMRQADVLATQLGLEPPVRVGGAGADTADIDSMTYDRKAIWMTGTAEVDQMPVTNNVYSELPNRISMYKISLNQLIPTGDTSIASGAGDQDYSKTPAGVEFQKQNLSIDDEDYKDNIYQTYEAKAKSMINYEFANMQGTDLMKLSDEERDILMKSELGEAWPEDEEGNPSNELEVIWDNARANFDFSVDPDQDKAKDDEKRLEGLMKVAELRASDPNLDAYLQESGKKLDVGELFAEIISLTSDNEKIIQDISGEDEQVDEMGNPIQQPMPGQESDPLMEQKLQQNDEKHQLDMQGKQMKLAGQEAPSEQMQDAGPEMVNEQVEIDPEEMQANLEAVMDEYQIGQEAAAQLLDMEAQGVDVEELKAALQPEAMV